MAIADVVGTADTDELAEAMRRTGLGVVPDVLPGPQLEDLRAYSRDAVRRRGDEFAYLTRDALAGTAIGELASSAQLQTLLSELYTAVVGTPPDPGEIVHPALRCLLGRSGGAQSLRFHFDSYAVTALLPLEIPTAGNRGDFLYFPNTRPMRRRMIANIADKAIYQNPASARFMASQPFLSRRTPQRLELTPGNMYVFCGYRTLHGNDRCDPDRLRSTALFHFGDPHGTDPLAHLLQRRVQRRAQRSGVPQPAAPGAS